jgi:pSer/pThr/pTyr-binding forkhead associated (FHA) protein
MSAAEKLNPAVQIKLRVLKGPHEGQSFHLSKTSFTLGRGPENEVVLINDPQISRQHARLQVVGQDIEIVNLSQKNKVIVGSEVIQKWKLVNESTFVIGDTEIQIIYDLGKPVSSAVSSVPTPSVFPSEAQVPVPPPPPTQNSPLVPVKPKQQVAKRPMPPAQGMRSPAQPRSQSPVQRMQGVGQSLAQQRSMPRQQGMNQAAAAPLTAAPPAPASAGMDPKLYYCGRIGPWSGLLAKHGRT